jgi:hypothetical protein
MNIAELFNLGFVESGIGRGWKMHGDVLLTLIYDEVQRAFGTTREALKSGR